MTVDPHRIGLKAVSEVPNARMNKPSSIKEPAELFRWNRFDIAFKYLYGVARERGWKTAYYEEMYKHHLGIWNNFSEHDNPAKTGFESYRSDFDDLLDEIGASGFDPIGVGCDMTGGSSGGPWIIKLRRGNLLNGITTYGYSAQPGALYGPYFRDNTANRIRCAAATGNANATTC